MIVVFDLDGTLVDSHNLHAQILTKIFEKYGINMKVPKSIDVSSASLKSFLMGFLPSDKWILMEEIQNEYAEEYAKNIGKVDLMPGAIEALETIKEKKAIFTAMPKKVAFSIINGKNIGKYFEEIITLDDVSRTKPDPEGLMLISERLNDPYLMVVGNGNNDILAAKNYGAISVFFSKSGKKHTSADFNIRDFRELPPLISALRKSKPHLFKGWEW